MDTNNFLSDRSYLSPVELQYARECILRSTRDGRAQRKAVQHDIAYASGVQVIVAFEFNLVLTLTSPKANQFSSYRYWIATTKTM